MVSYKDERLPWSLSTWDVGELLLAIPELKDLQNIIEQNDWHNDSALQQSLRLLDWVKQLPVSLVESIGIAENLPPTLLTDTVDAESGQHSLKALLGFAALIHDLGKASTFRRQSDGTTRCPGHEAVSAHMAQTICTRFDFSTVESRFIIALVGAHGKPYALFKKIATQPTPMQLKHISRFETAHGAHFLPLLLLAIGDLVTSHLEMIRPAKYQAVFGFYQDWLVKIWPGKRKM